MNERPFLHWLQKEIEQSAPFAQRHIILLNRAEDCLDVARELQARLDDPVLSGSITPLPLINGLSCPLISRDEVLSFQAVEGAEEDQKPASVHGITARLPTFEQSSSAEPFIRSKPFIPWGIANVQAPLAWKKSKGENIRIGVIDTGIDYTHPDLHGSIGGGINLIERHMPPFDDNGHGTHISGTIAASSAQGMTGTAPSATLYAVKAFDHNGSSYVADIIRGIEWCVQNQIHIINMSFGMKTRSPALESAVRAATREGLIIVASAGNEGKKNAVDYPARFPHTIAVGASTRTRRIAAFSNMGSEIDIYAPGEKIISTWLNGKYHALSGTSMATSHVSGVVALLLSSKPELTTKTIIHHLQQNASPIVSTKRKAGFLGEVNAVRTVKAVNRKKSS